MKPIKNNDFVSEETIKTYSDIDGLEVIEEYLLFKGTDHVREIMSIPFSELEKMAHIHYRLKFNETNKMYVRFNLDKYYKRNGMIVQSGWNGGNVKIPKDIFKKVDEIHAKYKTEFNKDF